jgi:hypothetical protein
VVSVATVGLVWWGWGWRRWVIGSGMGMGCVVVRVADVGDVSSVSVNAVLDRLDAPVGKMDVVFSRCVLSVALFIVPKLGLVVIVIHL